MADRPIIKIEINSEDFDKFREKFAAYQEELKAQPKAWEGANESVKVLSSRFEDAAGAFERLNKTAVNPKFAGETGVFTKFQKSALETRKDWQEITKQIEKSGKGLGGLAREMLSIGKLSGGLVGAAVGAGAALFAGTRSAASGLAGDNAKNRQLNLKPGVADAYGITYAKYGASKDQLSNFAQAKVDPSLWQPLLAAGVTQDEIQGDDAEQLARSYLQKAAKKWNSLPEGPARGSWLAGTRQDALGMDVASFNQAASWDDDDWLKSDADFAARRNKLALPQGKYDKGTDAEQDFETSSKEVGNALKGAFVELAPLVTTLTKKFADAISDFSKSGQLDMYIGDATTAFKELDAAMAWVNKLNAKINLVLPSIGKGSDGLDDLGIEVGKTLLDLDKWDKLGDAFSHTGGIQSGGAQPPRFGWDMSHPFGTIKGPGDADKFSMPGTFTRDPDRLAHIKALEIANGMPPGYLLAEENVESSGGKNNVNPTNPNVLGAMQFDQATAEKYGVNRYDERSSLEGGAKKLRDLYSKYGDWGKASASFDGFAGLDRDIAKYGDAWRDHIGEFQKGTETTDYLNKIEGQGVDLNGGGTGHVSTGTIAAVSKIAGFHPDNQIIDTASTARDMPPLLSRPDGMGALPAQQINVNVSAPPGSSVSVTTAGLPQ